MKEWLSGLVGESAANIVGFALIFVIILGGIFVVASIIRRFSGGTFASNGRGRQPRLSVMDAAAVDSRRKLVLIRRDDVEHLILIGGPTDVVVEQNIVKESRAHARAQSSRIEPEQIERFRQQEAIAAERNERAALPASPEKDEAIQLTSAIETPAYRKPEPAVEAPARPQAPERREEPRETPAPQAAAVRAPQAPVPPVVTPRPASRPAAPVAQAFQPPRPQPQPRAVAAEPASPRPAAPQPRPQAQTARLHPTYPLSQVSQGVLSSTSNAPAAAAATVAAGAATAGLGGVVPERGPSEPSRPAALDVTGPGVSSTPAPEFSRTAEEKRVEPEVPFAAPAQKMEPDDSLEDLGGALHDAIMADLGADLGAGLASPQKESPAEPEVDLFEDELLSSLDFSAVDEEKPANPNESDSIEEEMEKLLGDLTRDETRHK